LYFSSPVEHRARHLYPVYTMKLARRAGSTSARRAASSCKRGITENMSWFDNKYLHVANTRGACQANLASYLQRDENELSGHPLPVSEGPISPSVQLADITPLVSLLLAVSRIANTG